jgi:hypothetical protein
MPKEVWGAHLDMGHKRKLKKDAPTSVTAAMPLYSPPLLVLLEARRNFHG